MRWHGNVRPKCEGSIYVDVKLLFVLSKAHAVWFVQFVQWNPVIMSLARFWLFWLKIQWLFWPELCYIGKTTYKKKSTGFWKFQKFQPDKLESDQNRWGSVKYFPCFWASCLCSPPVPVRQHVSSVFQQYGLLVVGGHVINGLGSSSLSSESIW